MSESQKQPQVSGEHRPHMSLANMPESLKVILFVLAGLTGGGALGTTLGGGVSKEQFDAFSKQSQDRYQRQEVREEKLVSKLDKVLVQMTDMKVEAARANAESSAWRRSIERRLEQLEQADALLKEQTRDRFTSKDAESLIRRIDRLEEREGGK